MTLKPKFEEASKILPVQNCGKRQEIFYKGYKFVNDLESDSYYVISLDNHYTIINHKHRLFNIFVELPFKYICDVLWIKKQCNNLYKLEKKRIRGQINPDDIHYKSRKSDAISRLKDGSKDLNIKQ